MGVEISMTYKEKSVTETPEKEEKFKSVLGDIIVDEQGIERKEYKGEEHWERIGAHMEEAELFKGFLPWEHIDKIVKKDEHLKYPHVDIHLKKEEIEEEWEEKKLQIFFNKDSPDGYDEIDKFLRHIKLSWQANLQRHSLKTLSYSYDGEKQVMEAKEEEEVEEIEEAPLRDIKEPKTEERDNEVEKESGEGNQDTEEPGSQEKEEEKAGEDGEEEKEQKKEEGGYSNMVDNILEDIG